MTIPIDPTERDKYFIQNITNGNFEHDWLPITSTNDKHSATFYVSASPLRVNGIIITVSAHTQQIIADILNASLPTCKAMDLRQLQSDITIDPLPRPISNASDVLVDQSMKIDKEIAKQFPGISLDGKLISNTGKFWVLSNNIKPDKAFNYGWYIKTPMWEQIKGYATASPTNLYVIQGKAGAHNNLHQDYSQQAVFLGGSATVDGNLMTITDVLTSPELAPLISEEGILNILRQPV